MSKWEELWERDEAKSCLNVSNPLALWGRLVKTEGDLNLKEKRSLLTYAKMLREENTKLDIIRKLFDRFKIQLTDECYNAFMEVLGDE